MVRWLVGLLILLFSSQAQAAVQLLGGGFWSPSGLAPASAGVPSFVTVCTLAAATDECTLILQMPKAGTLNRFEVRLGTVAQAPGNGLTFSFRDVDLATGFPDTTQDQKCSVTTGITTNLWLDPGGFLGATACDSGAKRTAVQGAVVALVVGFTSFTAGDSVIINGINLVATASIPQTATFPYTGFNTAAAWGYILDPMAVALKYDDATYGYIPGTWPAVTLTTHSGFDSTDTPDERGLRCRWPGPVKLGGIWVRGDFDGDTDIVLYDSDGATVLDTKTLDPQLRSANQGSDHVSMFSSDYSIAANTYIRGSVKPGATTIAIYSFTMPAAAYLDGLELGQVCHATSAKNPTEEASWTQDLTSRYVMGFLVTGIDDGVQTGGSQGIIGGWLNPQFAFKTKLPPGALEYLVVVSGIFAAIVGLMNWYSSRSNKRNATTSV